MEKVTLEAEKTALADEVAKLKQQLSRSQQQATEHLVARRGLQNALAQHGTAFRSALQAEQDASTFRTEEREQLRRVASDLEARLLAKSAEVSRLTDALAKQGEGEVRPAPELHALAAWAESVLPKHEERWAEIEASARAADERWAADLGKVEEGARAREMERESLSRLVHGSGKAALEKLLTELDEDEPVTKTTDPKLGVPQHKPRGRQRTDI